MSSNSKPISLASASSRSATEHRQTRETDIRIALDLDGNGQHSINTPLPFLNHMLEAVARHGLFDLQVEATGDIEVDPHHTVEDIGLVLGDVVRKALGTRKGIRRYGSLSLPMDETLVTCALDFGGRPSFVWRVDGLDGKRVGTFDCELVHEFFAAFATRAECNLHFVLHHGRNAHHIIEACFKSFTRAMDFASQVDSRMADQVPSTKGTLTS